MKACLDQAYAGCAPGHSSIDHVLHQPPADALVLHGGIDRDGTNAHYRRPFIHEIAADDLAVPFGNHVVETGMIDQHSDHPGGDLTEGNRVGNCAHR